MCPVLIITPPNANVLSKVFLTGPSVLDNSGGVCADKSGHQSIYLLLVTGSICYMPAKRSERDPACRMQRLW